MSIPLPDVILVGFVRICSFLFHEIWASALRSPFSLTAQEKVVRSPSRSFVRPRWHVGFSMTWTWEVFLVEFSGKGFEFESQQKSTAVWQTIFPRFCAAWDGPKIFVKVSYRHYRLWFLSSTRLAEVWVRVRELDVANQERVSCAWWIRIELEFSCEYRTG